MAQEFRLPHAVLLAGAALALAALSSRSAAAAPPRSPADTAPAPASAEPAANATPAVALPPRLLPEPAPRDPRPSYELRHTSAGFLTLELGVSLVFSAGFVLAAGPAPKHCHWCGSNAFDESVRDALRAVRPRTAAAFGRTFSASAAPALAAAAVIPTALMRGRSDHAVEDTLIVFDGLVLTFGVTHGTKRLVARSRPAVHHGVVGESEYADKPSEWYQSFFSSDTSLAFSLVSSATTLSYLRGYPSAPWVLFAGSVIGASAGVFRIAADMHYATDVLVGAATGTAIGFALPFFVHGRETPGPLQNVTLRPLFERGSVGLLASGEL